MKLPGKKELKLVHIIYRHGISTPLKTYPKDPYKNVSFFPTGWGQLTNQQGVADMFQHGTYLRQRYDSFLGKDYSPDTYYVESTETDRTNVTAQCISAGLWQRPVPIHTRPLMTDDLLIVQQPNMEYLDEQTRIMTLPEVQEKLRQNAELFRTLSAHTGNEIKDFEDVHEIYHILAGQKAFGLTLPDWTYGLYPGKMISAVSYCYDLLTYTEILKRCRGGIFIQKLISDWKNYETNSLIPKGLKMFLYVGHASTIVNILGALDLWQAQVPQEAMNIFFELYYDRSNQKYYVQTFFRNVSHPNADAKEISSCSLDEFITMTECVVTC